MLLRLSCLLLVLSVYIVRGRVAPSRPYLKKLGGHNSTAEKKVLLPFEDGSGSVSDFNPDSCSYNSIQYAIYQLKSLAYRCVDQLEFENCCEPKFLGYNLLSSIYPIRLGKEQPKYLYCDMETYGGGWTVIFRRGSRKNFILDFNRSWLNFKQGFGKVDRDFWLGFRHIRYLTRQTQTELLVELKRDGKRFFAHYSSFSVGSGSTNFALSVGGYNKNSSLPDSLSHSNGFRFVTFEEELQGNPDVVLQYGRYSSFCTIVFRDSWWHGSKGNESCTKVSLFRDVGTPAAIEEMTDKMIWEDNGEKVGFDFAEMKIRPKTWECGKDPYSKYVVKRAFLSEHPDISNPFGGN